MNCSIRMEWNHPWKRAVVVAHEVPPREVHATPWTLDSGQARALAGAYARKNNLTIVDSQPWTKS